MDQSSKPYPREEEDDSAKAAAEQLLEECWFFNNLLDRKTAMSTNPYDPRTSSNYSQHQTAENSYEETFESIKKLNESRPSISLMRPPSLERKDSNPTAKGIDIGRRKSPLNTLVHAPSLPTSIVAQEIHEDEEIEFSMGKLIRQASLKSSDTMPLTNHAAKGVSAAVISRITSPRKQEFGNRKLERLRPRRAMNQLKTQKSLSDLESAELQELKRSKEDDMKAQIKFWARAVASNVRQ